MADQSDHTDYRSSASFWSYFQFMYRDGEAIVVEDPSGAQAPFYVDKWGSMSPMPHKCVVNVTAKSTQGYFSMSINDKSQIRMRLDRDGVCRGTKEHYAGGWTQVSKSAMQMAFQGIGLKMPKPVARPWGQPKADAPRPWDEVARDATIAPTWAAMPMVHTQHPSGRPAYELEECSACSGGGSSGLPGGMCSDCYGTGLMPKQQAESTEMNMQEMITVMQIQQGAKVVAAKYFTNNQAGFSAAEYHFKNVLGVVLVAGDLAVVQTKGDYALVKIVDPDVRANAVEVPLGELKHVISKVDTSSIKIVTEAENNAMHALALSEVTERLGKFKDQVGESTFNTMQSLLAPPTTKE